MVPTWDGCEKVTLLFPVPLNVAVPVDPGIALDDQLPGLAQSPGVDGDPDGFTGAKVAPVQVCATEYFETPRSNVAASEAAIALVSVRPDVPKMASSRRFAVGCLAAPESRGANTTGIAAPGENPTQPAERWRCRLSRRRIPHPQVKRLPGQEFYRHVFLFQIIPFGSQATPWLKVLRNSSFSVYT